MECDICGTKDNLVQVKNEDGETIYLCGECYEAQFEGYEKSDAADLDDEKEDWEDGEEPDEDDELDDEEEWNKEKEGGE